MARAADGNTRRKVAEEVSAKHRCSPKTLSKNRRLLEPALAAFGGYPSGEWTPSK